MTQQGYDYILFFKTDSAKSWPWVWVKQQWVRRWGSKRGVLAAKGSKEPGPGLDGCLREIIIPLLHLQGPPETEPFLLPASGHLLGLTEILSPPLKQTSTRLMMTQAVRQTL